MGDGATARAAYQEAVEYLCRNAEALRELIEPGLWEASFAAVRDEEPDTDAWRAAVAALHTAAEAAGIPGGLGLVLTMGVADWPAGPTPMSTGWICPTGRCARVDLRDATDGTDAADAADGTGVDATPTCALAGAPLRLVDG